MHAAIRRYQLAHESDADEVIRRVQEEFVPMMRDSAGFVAYSVVLTGKGGLLTISMFQDEAGAQSSSDRAREWVTANLSQFVQGAPQIDAGEVKVIETSLGA